MANKRLPYYRDRRTGIIKHYKKKPRKIVAYPKVRKRGSKDEIQFSSFRQGLFYLLGLAALWVAGMSYLYPQAVAATLQNLMEQL